MKATHILLVFLLASGWLTARFELPDTTSWETPTSYNKHRKIRTSTKIRGAWPSRRSSSTPGLEVQPFWLALAFFFILHEGKFITKRLQSNIYRTQSPLATIIHVRRAPCGTIQEASRNVQKYSLYSVARQKLVSGSSWNQHTLKAVYLRERSYSSFVGERVFCKSRYYSRVWSSSSSIDQLPRSTYTHEAI